MEFKEVGGHTFCPELLSDGVIIDVGCRGFVFALHFDSDKTVYCIDPDKKVFEDEVCLLMNAEMLKVAISDKAGTEAYYENGEGTCLQQIDPDQNHPFTPCKTITMEDLYKITGENVDVLKLDCEGAEYIILGEGFRPVPKQISVEFHRHCVPELHDRRYPAIRERLLEHYEIFNEIMEAKHGCAKNLWDVLFVKRDLISTE